MTYKAHFHHAYLIRQMENDTDNSGEKMMDFTGSSLLFLGSEGAGDLVDLHMLGMAPFHGAMSPALNFALVSFLPLLIHVLVIFSIAPLLSRRVSLCFCPALLQFLLGLSNRMPYLRSWRIIGFLFV